MLTSLDDETLNSLGIARLHLSSTAGTARAHAGRLAWLAHNAGATGFVCAATEVFTLRSMLGPKVTLVTPGIRAAGAATDDQKRVASVQSAIEDGADLLVVGRPIRNAADPAAAARAIVKDIEKAAAS